MVYTHCAAQRLKACYITLCLCPLQADAVDFITVEKLDSAIEVALNKRGVHNFAIDVDGNRYIEQTDGSTVVHPKSERHELTDGT